MRDRFSLFLHRCQMPVFLVLGLQSVNLVFLAVYAPELLPVAWLYPAGYLLSVIVSLRLPGRFRIGWGCITALVNCGVWFVLLPDAWKLPGMICAGVFGVAMVWSLRFAMWSAEQEVPDFWMSVGAVVQIVFFLASYEAEQLRTVVPRLSAIFFAYVLLLMLSRNRTSMINASDTRQRVTEAMRRKNKFLVFGLFGLALVIALLPSAYRFVLMILKWIIGLIDLLWSEAVPGTEKLDPSQLLGLDVLEGVPVHEDPLWVMDLLTWIVKAFFAVGGVWLLWKAVKTVWNKLPGLLRMLERYSSSVSQDYVDEVTYTRDLDLMENLRHIQTRRRIRRRDERYMTPDEKIRYRYQRLLYKYPQWGISRTARENLPAAAAQIYEKARYSHYPVSEEDVATFKNETKDF